MNDDINFRHTWFDVFMMALTMILFFLSNTFELAGIAFVFSFIIFILFCA